MKSKKVCFIIYHKKHKRKILKIKLIQNLNCVSIHPGLQSKHVQCLMWHVSSVRLIGQKLLQLLPKPHNLHRITDKNVDVNHIPYVKIRTSYHVTYQNLTINCNFLSINSVYKVFNRISSIILLPIWYTLLNNVQNCKVPVRTWITHRTKIIK